MLNRTLLTWDFTWDTDFIPAEMHYNPNNAHPNAPGANDIADLAELSYDLWEDDFSFFSFQNAAPFVTNEGQVDNNTSVILWVHDDNVNFLAGAFPFPNTRNDILNCNEDGPGTQTAVDIEFNRNPNVNWHFGVNPPANHQTGTFDFVEVLVHELGHGLGLAHTNNTNSIMLGNPFGGYGNRTGPVRGQTDGDLAARTYQHTVSSLSGTFTHSMVLSASTDQFDVDGTLTIPSSEFVELYPGIEFEVTSNGKLNIENGVQFAFGSNTGIDVYGQVDIDGTSSNPVVMEASGSNNWRGLLFEGSSTQGSVVRLLHVHDADIGVRLQFTGSGNVGFHNLRANGNTTGLHLFANSSLTINNGRFLSSDDDGVWIDDTGTVGFMSSTRASGNNDVGLRIDGGSIASFGGMFQDALAEFKNNTIGLEIDGSSHVGLGELFDDPPPSDPVCWPSKNYSTHTGGCNNILDNSSWDARVRGNSELMAQLTWWGISGPSVSVQSGSSAETNHELHDNAPVPSSVTLPPEPIVKTNEDSGQYLGSSITRIEQDTERDNALAFIRDIREQIADNRNVAWQKLDRARNHTNPVIEKWSQKLSLHLHMLEENYSEATNLGELLLRRADFSEKDRIYTAKHLFYGYLFDTRNPMRAAELLSELEAMDDRAAGRGLLAADFERLSGYAPYPVPAAVELQQEKTKLTVSNYPNPFNPATNIRFTLPATVDVSLRVYDVLGREVGILVNDRLEAGLHNVAFNGSNLSSGVYMYRLRAGEDVLNGSMVLVK